MLLNLVQLRQQEGSDRWDADIRSALANASWSLARSPSATAASTQALAHLLRDQAEVLAADQTAVGIFTGKQVTLTVEPSQMMVKVNNPVEVELEMTIEPGWHVGAPGQSNPFAIGMSVASLDSNLSVSARWPKSQPFQGPEGTIAAYRGTVRIPLTVEVSGPVTESTRIMLTWQACNDRVCAQPETQRIPLSIQVEDDE